MPHPSPFVMMQNPADHSVIHVARPGSSSTNNGQKGPSFMFIVIGCLICVALGLFGLNIYSSQECQHKSNEELMEYLETINRRLLEAESENIRNSVMMDKVSHLMQSKLGKSEKLDLEEMMSLSQDEAVKISMLLASQPAPEVPHFYIDSLYLDAEKLADAVDDVFLEVIKENSEGVKSWSQSSSEFDDTESPLITDEEAMKACTRWRDEYSVVLGVSWGSLPINLQSDWKKYDCDYHLQGANEPNRQYLISQEEYETGKNSF